MIRQIRIFVAVLKITFQLVAAAERGDVEGIREAKVVFMMAPFGPYLRAAAPGWYGIMLRLFNKALAEARQNQRGG